jgi:hypothetical protein
VSGKPIMIVSLRVAPEKEAEFNEFYHHRYIPKLLEVVPEFRAARRYEEYGVAGNLKWFTKRFITVYEIASEAVLSQALEGLSRPGREEERAQWARWKAEYLKDVTRVAYRQTYAHERVSWDGPFGSRPFFMVTVEVRPEVEPAFRSWYEGEYLPKIMADVPAWVACRRYTSVDREPIHYHTIYEVQSLQDLEEAFALMRSPHRFSSNAAWNDWVGPAITAQDASSYRPIFRRPG